MTRRWSVMRIPVAAQRASIPVALIAGTVFKCVCPFSSSGNRLSATGRALRQVAAHQNRVQLFAAGLPVITFAASDNPKSGAGIKPSGWLIVFLHLQEHGAYAAPGEVPEMCQQ